MLRVKDYALLVLLFKKSGLNLKELIKDKIFE